MSSDGCLITKDSVNVTLHVVKNPLHDTAVCFSNQFPLTYSVTINHFSASVYPACVVYNWGNGIDSGQIVGCYSNPGTFTFSINSPGTYTVTIQEADGYGLIKCVAVYIAHVSIGCNLIQENNNELLGLYPNPANTSINLEFGVVNTEVKITDVFGNSIKSFEVKNKKEIEIDVSNLIDGVYFLNIKTPSGVITRKIIIQH